MKLHSNAKLTSKGRLELANSVIKHGMTLDAVAAASKVSTRTATSGCSGSRPRAWRGCKTARLGRRGFVPRRRPRSSSASSNCAASA